MTKARSAPRLFRPLLLTVVLAALAACFGAAGARAEDSFWGGPGSGNGQFSGPTAAAVAADGSVYVADRGNRRIQHFSASGGYLGQWGSFGTDPGKFSDDLVGLAVSPSGSVFTLDRRGGGGGGFRIQRFDASGVFEAGWGSAEGSDLGQFDEPSGIAVGPSGTVYVVDTGNRRVQSFAPDGSSPAAWGTVGGGGEGAFSEPVAIAVDQTDGTVYVADAGGTARVQAFTPTGGFLRQWGSTGIGQGQFFVNGLVGIAVGGDGDVYTREQVPPLGGDGSRFQRFTSSGGFLHLAYRSDLANSRGLAVADGALYAPDTGAGRLAVLDLSTPKVSLLAPYLPVTVGQTARFQSTATVVLGEIVDYEWDLDGDGKYELDTGTTPEAAHVYTGAGDLTASLRVTSNSGGTAVDQRQVHVVDPPPPGPAGVSIDDGAQFTNNLDVAVRVRWPREATSLLISNDGGFVPAASLAVAPTISWRLDASGPERQPKTIYVRFSGGYSGPETYQDEILLDRTAPRIKVTILRGDTAGARRVRLQARDNLSGVNLIHLTRQGEKPGAWKPFRGTTTLSQPAPGLHARVRDRAGNSSPWVRVRGACKRCS